MGRLQTVTKEFKQRMLAREEATSAELTRQYSQTWGHVNRELGDLLQKMQDTLDAGGEINQSWLYEARRLDNLTRYLLREINAYGDTAQRQISALQKESVTLGQQLALAQLNEQVPDGVNWTFGRPSEAALHDLVGALDKDSPLYDLFDEFGPQAAGIAKDTLVTGVTLGQSPRQIARDMADAMQMPRDRALTICRTEAFRAYRSAAVETYRANSDVVGQWRWLAAKDPTTCAMCLGMDGTLHDLDEDLDSHPNCRCAAIPVTKDWSDILGPYGIDTSGIPDTRLDYQSGADWFADQDAATQRDILGASKYNAYQAGDLTLADLVGVSHDADWGTSHYEKSLKDLGLNASDYSDT